MCSMFDYKIAICLVIEAVDVFIVIKQKLQYHKCFFNKK